MPTPPRKRQSQLGDLLLTDDYVDREREPAGQRRPACLKQFLDIVGNTMLSTDAPLRARWTAGKVFQRLMWPSPSKADGVELAPGLERSFQDSLKVLAKRRDDLGILATSLAQLQPRLRWSIGKSGPFASRNFEKSHAHSVVVGPGGIEERGDLRIGLTLMKAYGRFPDHKAGKPRSYLFLAPGEFCGEQRTWLSASLGSVRHSEEGDWVAFRCTKTPLLFVWCNLE